MWGSKETDRAAKPLAGGG